MRAVIYICDKSSTRSTEIGINHLIDKDDNNQNIQSGVPQSIPYLDVTLERTRK